jgi:sec-independent protein translocase protein TatA
MPGSIGWQGLVVILLVLLIVFGPKRLPELGRSLGRGMREFKDSVTGSDHDDDDEQPRELSGSARSERASR